MKRSTQASDTSQGLIKQKSAPNNRKAALHLVVRRGIEPPCACKNICLRPFLCRSHKNSHDKNGINYTRNNTRNFQDYKCERKLAAYMLGRCSDLYRAKHLLTQFRGGFVPQERPVITPARCVRQHTFTNRPTVAKSIFTSLKQALNAVLNPYTKGFKGNTITFYYRHQTI